MGTVGIVRVVCLGFDVGIGKSNEQWESGQVRMAVDECDDAEMDVGERKGDM